MVTFCSALSLSSSSPFLPARQYFLLTHNPLLPRNRLEIPLPDGVQGTTLGQLRSTLVQQLGFSSFKVLYSGGVMVDDRLPLSSYGIKNRSILAIVGSGKAGGAGGEGVSKVERELKSAKRSKKQVEEVTEAKTVEAIKARVLETKDTLGARMGQFKNTVSSLALSPCRQDGLSRKESITRLTFAPPSSVRRPSTDRPKHPRHQTTPRPSSSTPTWARRSSRRSCGSMACRVSPLGTRRGPSARRPSSLSRASWMGSMRRSESSRRGRRR